MRNRTLLQKLILVLVMATVGTTAAGCKPAAAEFNVGAIDNGDFSDFANASQLDLNQLTPAKPYTYWEWVRVPTGADVAVASGGIERTKLDPKVRAALDDLSQWGSTGKRGFGMHCLPDSCWEYVATVDGKDVQKWTDLDDIRTFLGEIDTPQDAILLVTARSDVFEVESIGAIDDGYALLVRSEGPGTDPSCNEISLNTNRELLHVSRLGEVTVMARKLLDRFCGIF